MTWWNTTLEPSNDPTLNKAYQDQQRVKYELDNPFEFEAIPTTIGVPEYRSYYDAERTKRWEMLQNQQVTGLDFGEQDEAVFFFDEDSNELVYGMMDSYLASEQSMQASYERGMFARNAANDRYDAMMALGGYDDETWSGTLLDLSDEEEDFFRHWMEKSKWNVVAAFQGLDTMPFAEFAAETPDDVFKREMLDEQGLVKLFNTKKAVETLKTVDNGRFTKYVIALGSEEAVLHAVSGARNPADFWFKINNAVQTRAHMAAADNFAKKAGAVEETWAWGYNFVINGIVNDPDMLASMAIAAALNTVSLGTLGTTLLGAQALKKGMTGVKAIRASQRIKTGAKFSNIAKNTINWLPERIGPHLLSKTIFKNTADYGWGRFVANRLADGTEGFITGGLAEIMNQRSKVDTGKLREMNWDHVMTEALYEAAFSPFINPVMGRLMVLPTLIGHETVGGVMTETGKGLVGEKAWKYIKHAFDNPADITAISKIIQTEVHLRDNWARLTGQKYSEADISNESLNRVLGVMHAETSLEDDAFLIKANQVMQNLVDSDPDTQNEVELADRFIETAISMGILGKKSRSVEQLRLNFAIETTIDNAFNKLKKDSRSKLTEEQAKLKEINQKIKNLGDGKKVNPKKFTTLMQNRKLIEDSINRLTKQTKQSKGDYINTVSTNEDFFGIFPSHIQEGTRKHFMDNNPKRRWETLSPQERMEALGNFQESVKEGLDKANEEYQAARQEKVQGIETVLDKVHRLLGKKTRSEQKEANEDIRKERLEREAAEAQTDLEKEQRIVRIQRTQDLLGEIEESGDLKSADKKVKEAARRRYKELSEEIENFENTKEIDTVLDEDSEIDETDPVKEETPIDPVRDDAESSKEDLEERRKKLQEDLAKSREDSDIVAETITAEKLAEVDNLLNELSESVTDLENTLANEYSSRGGDGKKLIDLQNQIANLKKEIDKKVKAFREKFKNENDAINETEMERLFASLFETVLSEEGDGKRLFLKNVTEEQKKELTWRVINNIDTSLKGAKKAQKDLSNFLKSANPEHHIPLKTLSRLRDQMINVQIPAKAKALDATPEWKEARGMIKEFNKLNNEYSVEDNKLWSTKLKHNRNIMITAETMRQVIETRNAINEENQGYEEAFNTLIEGKGDKDKITWESVAATINPTTKVFEAATLQVIAADKGTLTVAEAKEINKKAQAEVKKYVDEMRPGWLRYRLSIDSDSVIDGVYAHELDNDYVLNLRRSPDEILELPDTTIAQQTVDLQAEEKALEQWLVQLYTYKTTPGIEGGLPLWKAFVVMPKYLRQKLKVTAAGLLRDAIIDTDMITKKSKLIILRQHADKVMLNLDQAIEILESWILKNAVAQGEWKESLARVSTESRIDWLLDEKNTNGAARIMMIEETLTDLQRAQRPLHRKMWKKYGYLTAQDEFGYPVLSGDPAKKIVTSADYVSEVRLAAQARIEHYANDPHSQGILIAKLLKRHPDIFENTSIHEQKGDWLVGNLWNKLESNFSRLFSLDPNNLSDIKIEDFGNGRLDWQTAKSIGEALIDTLMEKSPVNKAPKISTDPNQDYSDIISETTIDGGESTTVTTPEYGQSNRNSPISLVQVIRGYDNVKFTTRLKAVLNNGQRFSKKERAKIAEWIQESNFISNPSIVEDRVNFGILPPIVGGSLASRMITWDEMTEFYKEMLLDWSHIASNHIHDEYNARYGSQIEFNKKYQVHMDDDNVPSAGLSHIVPFGRIGEALALEETWDGFQGYSDVMISHAARVTSKVMKETGEGADIFSEDHWKDSTFSGLFEIKTLALAGGLNALGKKMDLESLVVKLEESVVSRRFSSENDYYQSTALRVATMIRNMPNKGLLKKLDEKIFSVLRKEGSDTKMLSKEDWGQMDESDPRYKQARAIREFFKVPVMRRLYQAGFSFWTKEFKNLNRNTPGAVALRNLEEAFGLKGDQRFTKEEVNRMGELFFKNKVQQLGIMMADEMNFDVNSGSVVIDAALGLSKDSRSLAIDFLRLDISQSDVTNRIKRWVELQQVFAEEGKTAELGEKHPMYSHEYHKDMYEAVINDLTKKIFGISYTHPDWAEKKGIVNKRYSKRKDRALAIIESLSQEERDNIIPGTDTFKRIEEALYGVERDAKGKAKGGNEALYKSLGYFKALNLVNASSLKMNMTRMQTLADILGLKDFDPNDFLGLESYLQHHLAAPTTKSARTIDSMSGYGMGTQGSFLERVSKNPALVAPRGEQSIFVKYAEKHQIPVETIIGEDGKIVPGQSELIQEIVGPYLGNKDARDVFGMFDLVDNPYKNMAEEDFNDMLEDLMYKNLMMQFSSFDTPPISTYTNEDTTGGIWERGSEEWLNHTIERGGTSKTEGTLRQEMDEEMSLWTRWDKDKDANAKSILDARSAAGQLVNKQVANNMKVPWERFYHQEDTQLMGEFLGEDSETLTMIQTANQTGILSMRPRYKRMSYFDRGVHYLQRLGMKNEIRDVLGSYIDLSGHEFTPEEGALPTAVKGFTQPWEEGNLPKPLPLTGKLSRRITDVSEVGRKAQQDLAELEIWADRRGLMELMHNNPVTLPYFVNLMRLDKIRRKIVRYAYNGQDITHKRNSKIQIAKARLDYLIALHTLTYMSRDIKTSAVKALTLFNRGKEVATTVGIPQGMEWQSLLTNVNRGMIDEDTPSGYLLDPTLLDQQIRFGPVPSEGMIITLTDEKTGEVEVIEGDSDHFLFKETELVSSVVQSGDFNKFMVAVLYTAYITDILKVYRGGKYNKIVEHNGVTVDLVNDPNAWEQHIEESDKKQIIATAQIIAREEGGLNIDFGVTTEMVKGHADKDAKDLLKLNVIMNQAKVTRRQGGRDVDISAGLRSRFSGIGFGIQTTAPRVLKGKRVKLGLTQDSSTYMFALLENSRSIADMRLSSLFNKNLRTKYENGVVGRANPLPSVADAQWGFNMDAMNRQAVIDSEALQMIARIFDKDLKLPTVKNVWAKMDNVDVEVTDLDRFTSPDGMSDILGNYGHIAQETLLSPVEETLIKIRRRNLRFMDKGKVDRIQNTLTRVRRNPNESLKEKGALFYLGLMLERGQVSLSDHIMGIFVDSQAFFTKEGQQASAYALAQEFYKSINGLLSEKHTYYNNPYAEQAKEWLWAKKYEQDSVGDDLSEAFAREVLKDSFGDERERQSAMNGYALALGEELESNSAPERQWLGEITDKDLNIPKTIRSYTSFMEYANTQPAARKKLLKAVGDQIKNITDKKGEKGTIIPGLLGKNDARLVRALVLRMYQYNPLNLQDLEFDIKTDVLRNALGTAKFDESTGKFVVTLSDKLMGNGHRAVHTIAHELAHVATLKFVDGESSDWKHWLYAMRSSTGKSWLKKMVVAFEGGVETLATDNLVDHYMSAPHEFVAAVVQYSLLNDISSITALKEFNGNEAKVHKGVMNLVSRVTQYVRRQFVRLSSVFESFKREDKQFYDSITAMTQRALGWDETTKSPLAKALNPIFDGEVAQRSPVFQRRAESMTDNEFHEQVLEYQRLVKEHGAAHETARKLRAQLSTATTNTKDVIGVTRFDYFNNLNRLLLEFRTDKDAETPNSEVNFEQSILNFRKMAKGNRLTGPDYRLAFSFFMRQVSDVYGDPTTGNFAGTVKKAGGMVRKLAPFLDEGAIGTLLTNMTIGSAGGTRTWRAPTIFSVMLSILLDDRVARTANDVSNSEGMPSVQTELNELNFLRDALMAIDKEMGRIPKKYREGIQSEILHKVDDKTHEIVLPAEITGEKAVKIKEQSERAATVMRDFMLDLMERGQSAQIYSKDFSSFVPYRLKRQWSDSDMVKENFQKTMTTQIAQKIFNHRDTKIDGLTFYLAKLLPRIDSDAAMMAEMEKLWSKPETKGIAMYLIHKVLIQTRPDYAGYDIETQKASIEGLYSSMKIGDHATDMMKGKLVDAIISTMNEMSGGTLDWKIFSERVSRFVSGNSTRHLKRLYQNYIPTETGVTPVDRQFIKERLSHLSVRGVGVPDHIYFMSDVETGAHVQNSGTEIDSVSKLHFFNLLNKSLRGLHFPNNTWAIPNFAEVSKMEAGIKKDIITAVQTNPAELVGQFKKSLGDQIIEIKMMRDRFRIHGDYGDVLHVAREAFREAQNDLYNPDGTRVDPKHIQDLDKSMEELEGKWDFIRGISRGAQAPNAATQFFADIAPSLTKIAFGGNLALASASVEGIFNAISAIMGPKKLPTLARNILSPILILKPSNRKRVARELLHMVEAVTQGYIPEFERPAEHIAKGAAVRFLDKWGSKMMIPAKHVITGIAISRAITIRSAILQYHTTDSLQAFYLAHKDGRVTTDAELKAEMRIAKMDSGDFEVVRLMIKAGLFGEGTFERMTELFDKTSQGEDFYSLGEILQHMNTQISDATTPEFRSAMSVITKLRTVEKSFIERVLISPNAFDIHTNTKKRMGVLDTVWDIFRRYPVLFVSQKVIRASGEKTPLAFGTQLMTMLILDMLYMMLLRIAAGNKPAEIIDEFEEDQLGFWLHYGPRLPLFGQYLPIIMDMVKETTGSREGQGAGFIPLAALSNSLKGIWDVTSKTLGGLGGARENDLSWSEVLNAARIVPFLGDSLVRGALHMGAENLRTAKVIDGMPMSKKRENYKARGGNLGRTREVRDMDLLNITTAIMRETDFSFEATPVMTDFTKDMFGGSYDETSPQPNAVYKQSSPGGHVSVQQDMDSVGSAKDSSFDKYAEGDDRRPENVQDIQSDGKYASNMLEAVKKQKGSSEDLADSLDT